VKEDDMGRAYSTDRGEEDIDVKAGRKETSRKTKT
jgi:hypothetical protein